MWSSANLADLKKASRPRSLYSSKRENGRVVIVGGSERFHGAPIHSALSAYSTLAALRIGTGYAITCVPKYDAPVVMKASQNLIVRAFREDTLSDEDLPMIKEEVAKANAIAIGPGMGRKVGSLKAAATIAKYCISLEKKVVVDADALYSLRSVGKLTSNAILTPNQKEFSLFFGGKLDEKDLDARTEAAIWVSKKLGCVLLLKGHQTIITDGNRTKVVKSKSSALATMGTGDILSGMIAGYAALNSDAFIAATAGAYLLSLTGDLMYKKKGNHGIASDLVELIPKVLKQFDKNVK